MSYQESLEAAGATVLEFESFGSYQGEWWALVEYNGQRGWVGGSYGSCSGCDAFEGEFGFVSHEGEDKKDHYGDWASRPDCAECAALVKRVADFGKTYLDTIHTQDEAEKEVSRNIEWDSDARPMLDFIKRNAA